jgi:hypothetical protein
VVQDPDSIPFSIPTFIAGSIQSRPKRSDRPSEVSPYSPLKVRGYRLNCSYEPVRQREQKLERVAPHFRGSFNIVEPVFVAADSDHSDFTCDTFGLPPLAAS